MLGPRAIKQIRKPATTTAVDAHAFCSRPLDHSRQVWFALKKRKEGGGGTNARGRARAHRRPRSRKLRNKEKPTAESSQANLRTPRCFPRECTKPLDRTVVRVHSHEMTMLQQTLRDGQPQQGCFQNPLALTVACLDLSPFADHWPCPCREYNSASRHASIFFFFSSLSSCGNRTRVLCALSFRTPATEWRVLLAKTRSASRTC